MCKFLKIARSSIYYRPVKRDEDTKISNNIKNIFEQSRSNYGSRKIKKELAKIDLIASRRHIMDELGLVSNYTVKQYKVAKTTCNNDIIDNVVNRAFDREQSLDVVVSDLTYVNVSGKWNYVCLLIDLYNREIIGYSCGKHKTAELVKKAFYTINRNINDIKIFHTDRGSEFKNKIIDEILTVFNIERSLSAKGCPYDNAVAEAMYKVFKTEFAFNRTFNSFEELELELFDYVNWFNNIRIHGSLNYMTPVEYRQVSL